MKSKILFLFALSIGLTQFMFGQNIPVSAQLAPTGYLIGPNDVLKISVLGEPQFEVLSATVDEDGRIQIPFSEEGLMAKCHTEKQLKGDVVQLLKKYLKDPQVSVNVIDRKSRPPATVFGEIRTPMQVGLTRPTRLLELISFAGGVTEDAGGMIQVYRMQRPVCGQEATDSDWVSENTQDSEFVPSRMYSLSSLRLGRDEANPVINPGDVVVVQRALPVYITGEVGAPQGVYIKEEGLSLSEALAKIGGVKKEAKTKDIKVYRLKPNSKERDTISANLNLIKKGEQKDLMLEPYDIVEVNHTTKPIGQIVFETLTGVGRTALSGFGQGLPQKVLY